MHYPAVIPSSGRDRIRKARLMGLNAIETYVAWNAHEPVRGRGRRPARSTSAASST